MKNTITKRPLEELMKASTDYIRQEGRPHKGVMGFTILHVPSNEIAGKKCRGACGKFKHLEEFDKSDTGIAGKGSYCKACKSSRQSKPKEKQPKFPANKKELLMMCVEGKIAKDAKFKCSSTGETLTFSGSFLIEGSRVIPFVQDAEAERTFEPFIPSKDIETTFTLHGDHAKRFCEMVQAKNMNSEQFVEYAVIKVLETELV